MLSSIELSNLTSESRTIRFSKPSFGLGRISSSFNRIAMVACQKHWHHNAVGFVTEIELFQVMVSSELYITLLLCHMHKELEMCISRGLAHLVERILPKCLIDCCD